MNAECPARWPRLLSFSPVTLPVTGNGNGNGNGIQFILDDGVMC